jgi:hypothetical protein
MDHTVCPGAKFLRQPRPEIFSCPDCGEEVEIWSDEIRGTCSACGKTVFREGVPSCVEWCKYGKECVGEEAFGTYQRNRALGIKHRLLQALQRQELLSPDETGIRERAATWAEALLEREPGNWHLVIPAVLVHHVDFGERSGEGILQRILLAQGLDPDDVEAVRSILEALDDPGSQTDVLDARLVKDAWALAELDEDGNRPRPVRREAELRGRLSTAAATTLVREQLTAVAATLEDGAAEASRRKAEMTEESDA